MSHFRTGWYKEGFDPHPNNIAGFSHIHAWSMAGLLTMPTVGELKVTPGPMDKPDSGYALGLVVIWWAPDTSKKKLQE